MALDEARLATRLEQQPLPSVYRWLQRQPKPAMAVEAARYHQWLGQIAMRLGDAAAAVEHFEAAVLAYPYALGARLELALAYAELGNPEAARASLRALHAYRGGAELPPEAADTLDWLEQRLEQQPAPASSQDAVENTFTLAQGFDSNANLGSRHRSIPLNLFGLIPDEAVLADASRAQASHFTRLAATTRLPIGELVESDHAALDDWQLLGGLGAQEYHDLDRLQRRDAYLGAAWQSPRRHERLTSLLQYQHVEGIGTAWYLDADYRWLVRNHWLLQLGGQWQQEPTGRNSLRVTGGVWREWQGMLLWGQASWQERRGRPAGDTWRWRLGGQGPTWLAGPLEATAYAHLEQRGDTENYNFAFFGNTQRRETTTTLGVHTRLPLQSRLELGMDARWERTKANLALFEADRWSLEASLRWRW
ncbi:hypothetical protein [Halomonas sp. H10-9-1]|uniref:tetratricopeptide repeat protein n=1 Tax=Halomonas sp. H10-9-1 TaxID=2950871 RepID=UPI0032DF46D3